MKKNRKKVFVGLSGGVDSSVSAALLKEAGYDVTGVFLKAWHPDFLPCDWIEDRRDAMRVAAHLDIPFLTLDLEKEYKRQVVDYMIAEYKKGRTPNPDVMCNKEIKFGLFLKRALEMGADLVATGHYAVNDFKDGKFNLKISKDTLKDQTYFLWTLTQDQLSHILFPVGRYKKEEVRKLAKKFGLPTAEKKDSQGLCFIGKVDMKEFLLHYIRPKKGRVLDMSGKAIGEHDGAAFFTIGERHGFTVHSKRVDSTPLYVVAKDIEKNTITVSDLRREEADDAQVSELALTDTNWIPLTPEKDKTYMARARYRQELFPVKIETKGKNAKVNLKKPQMYITPGQSLVVYDGEKCIGGGIIR